MMSRPIALIVCYLFTCGTVISQPQPPVKDQRIEQIVREVSSERIIRTIDKLVSFGTRHTLSDTSNPARGIGAARRWILSEFQRIAAATGGNMSAEFDYFIIPPSPRVPQATAAVNVVATLRPKKASDEWTNRTLVICAHFDSRATDVMDATSDAPGADDDGSGTALVLELARVLSTSDLHATVKFICFTGEEQGLFGSQHWARMAAEKGLDIEAVLSNDIVGGVRGGDGVVDSTSARIFSEAFSPLDTGSVFSRKNALGMENDGASRTLARYCKEIGERYVPNFTVRMIYRGDRFLRGGDHLPFHQAGFPAVRFSEASENFDHQHQLVRLDQGRQYGDLVRYVNAGYCAQIARVNAAVAASLAFAPPPPRSAGLLTRNLSYGTNLVWNKVSAPDLAGYYIRWRETTSPVWQNLVFTADTSATLTASKDDYFFGVQAVNREGDVSIYSLPSPIR